MLRIPFYNTRGIWIPPNSDYIYYMIPRNVKALSPSQTVHGLGAHPDRTWVSNNTNWLEDEHMLPATIPNSRILTFGYSSDWLGEDAINQRLPLVAEQLLCSLVAQREACPTRPLVFIGHCFGGLVIEKAVILAKLHDDDYPRILQCIAGIAFLGTPHRGSATQSKAAIIASVASVFGKGEMTSLLKTVEKDSEVLEDLLHDFTRVANKTSIPLFCFFEQRKSDIAKILKPVNKYLPQFKELVVDERSGCIEGFPKLGLPIDHFQINRYSDAADGNFVYIKEEIKTFVQAAPTRVQLRLRPTSLANGTSMIDDDRDLNALNALFVTDPSIDMDMIRNQKDEPLENTGAWILCHEAFTSWLNVNDDQTLWIHGDPGKGKTMLAISLVKEIGARINLEGSASTTSLAYFFCDNKDSRRNNATTILRGILYQLLCQKPELCVFLRDQYEKQKERLFNSPNSLLSLWSIFRTISSQESLSRIFIVIDALDECEAESAESLLTLLEPYFNPATEDCVQPQVATTAQTSPCKIKWLITSRNELTIAQSLSRCPDISLEANHLQVESFVDKFIDFKVEKLRKRKGYNRQLCDFVKETLRERAEGTFLWVALACRELSKPTVLSINTKNVLLKLPSGLVPLYGRIMEQVVSFEDEEFANYAKFILRSMVMAFRPLTLLELGVVAGLPDEHREDAGLIEEYLKVCGSLVTIRDHIAYFVHQSAKTFLLANGLGHILSADISMDHQVLALNCFDYIGAGFGCEQKSISDTTDETASYVQLEYPTLFWIEHVRRAPIDTTDRFDIHSEFFCDKSTYRKRWLDEYWPRTHARWEKKADNFNSLHLAAFAGFTRLLQRLLVKSNAADINAVDSLGNTALVWAAKNGFDTAVLQLTNSKADIEIKNDEGVTALHCAAGNGHSTIVEYLHEKRASIETLDKNAWTPLHRAAYNGHAHIVRLLINLGANIEALDGSTWTAMHRAATMGQTEVVRLLIDHKASMEMLDREGMTPLLHAAWAGQHEIISIFLDSGMDVNEKDHNGWTALHNAAWNGYLETITLLIKRGADVKVVNADGSTALHHATWSGHAAVVDALLAAGADPDAKAYDEGEIPLQQAAWRGHLSCLKLLLAVSSGVDEKNVVGHTALHHAASNGHDQILLLLLDHGSNPKLVDKHGQTARALAEANEHETAIDILEAREREFEDTDRLEGTTPVDLPLDSGVAEALGVPVGACTVEPHQAEGFFVPEKITVNVDGTKKYFYMKSGEKKEMFESEYISLSLLHEAVPTLAPKPIAWGKFSRSDGYYLVTEWIDEETENGGSGPGTGMSLAQKVAKLHTTPAPIPPGHSQPMFGFPMRTYCGSTPQKNDWVVSWADFYANNRLRHICQLIEENHGTDKELTDLLEKLVDVVVPRLLGDGRLGGEGDIEPVLIHGDLWEGNRSKGKFDYRDGIEPVTYDPSCCYAHSEFELCLMRMFGGFSAGFFNEYHYLVPKTKPKKEYDDRMELYELYHYLNHYAIYCGGYRDDAIQSMKKLCKKYTSV